jgi:branched-chain amino acid transport system substrate-binding protein
MRARPTSTHTLGAVIAALALVAAGCSSSSHGTSAATTNPNLRKSTIVIGMENASTGSPDGPEYGGNVDVAKAWETWVNNDAGGINGHPVKIVFADTKDDPATAHTAAQTLVTQDKVIAEVGGGDSVTTATWSKVFTDAKVPVIGGEILDNSIGTSSPYLFWLTPALSTVAPLMVDTAKTAGAKRWGAVLCSESTSCAGAVALWQPRVASLGLNWGGYVQVAAAAPSYTSSCLTLQQNGSNFVELAVAAQVAVRVIKACKQQGFVPDQYGVATASFDGPALAPLTTGGAAITGVLVGFPWWTDTAPAKQYRDVMSKYGPKKLKSENDAQSNTWTALEMFRKAMANASDNPTSAEVEQAMDNVKDEDLGGLLPEKVSFTAGQPSKVINCVWRGELSDGKYSAGETQCLSPS